MRSRRTVALWVLLAAFLAGSASWMGVSRFRESRVAAEPIIERQPVVFESRTFDPNSLPADMPPMTPDEEAVCDSNFVSDAKVSGNPRQVDATNASVIVTQVKVVLRLRVTIWLPVNASQHVAEHEDGHRQISEYYYQRADEIARKIATKYLGKEVLITGGDLQAELNKLLLEMSAEINEEYNRELNPESAQDRYDAITDHSRNDVAAKDAVAAALKDPPLASGQ